MVAVKWCDESCTASLDSADCMVSQHDLKDQRTLSDCCLLSGTTSQPFVSFRALSSDSSALGDVTGPLGLEFSSGSCRVLTWRAADRQGNRINRGCRRNAKSSPQLHSWTLGDNPLDDEAEPLEPLAKKGIIALGHEGGGIRKAAPPSALSALSGAEGSSVLAGGVSESPTQLRRIETVGRRDGLVGMIGSSQAQAVSISDGQTGSVYALEVGGEKIAVFKPESGEHFTRRSLGRGHGCVREEAVYLVDRVASSKAGVPVTSRMDVEVEGVMLRGSVQAFVADAVGFIEDFAMPREAKPASEFVPQEVAEALAMLDMRVFNMDRHTGNLLLLGHSRPHGLGPIDHGCCLPPWWKLGEANFDAWYGWAQLREPPCEATRRLAREAAEGLPQTCDMVRDAGLEEVAILTLRICTLLVSVGVGELDLPCSHLAALMLRDEVRGFQELSWLESKVLACANAAGATCVMQVNDVGEQELVVEQDGAGLQTEVFLAGLVATFRAEAAGAAASGAPR